MPAEKRRCINLLLLLLLLLLSHPPPLPHQGCIICVIDVFAAFLGSSRKAGEALRGDPLHAPVFYFRCGSKGSLEMLHWVKFLCFCPVLAC